MSSQFTAGSNVGPATLVRFLGEGAAGMVYLGTHRSLGIDVAVKILKDDPGHGDAGWRERFQREARIAARLNHPGIVRVLDSGEEGSRPYIVMEYVDGMSLDQWLARRDTPVPEATGLRILLACAVALIAAHGEGIVHRDLKPGNIMLTRKGQLKIADLGLARDQGGTSLTRERVAVGTPAYMAPEALTPGAATDHRIDLYALGVIGYALAFRQLPYEGAMSQVIAGHLAGTADWNRSTAWSKDAVALIRRMMAVDPAKRPQDAAQLAAQLRPLLGGTAHIRRGTRSAQPGASSGARPAPGGTGSASGSGSSFDATQLGRFLDGAFAEHSTEVDGRRITHTTGRERIVVWVVLAVVVGAAVAAFILSK